MFKFCKVTSYIHGNITQPGPMHNPNGTNKWDFNDFYVAMLIYKNISAVQKVYVG